MQLVYLQLIKNSKNDHYIFKLRYSVKFYLVESSEMGYIIIKNVEISVDYY